MKRLSTEEFIQKARKVHGDVYDYSLVRYIDAYTKVSIICKKHGIFTQTPKSHLHGSGCRFCSVKFPCLSTDDFVSFARKIHGSRYDYSKVQYVKSHANIVIICPVHGEFLQMPCNHLHGEGCPYCASNQLSNVEEFIIKARKIHGNKYNYSKVHYMNCHVKVIITCPIHGDFKQTPNKHLLGENCPMCMGHLKFTTDEFIDRARKIHGSRYDYSKVQYVNSCTKVIITCLIHGDFKQVASSHLAGIGCPWCAGVGKFDTAKFITVAKKVHGNKYDYSKVHYVNSHTHVIITCSIHGDFEQQPAHHLKGHGCPCCKESRGERRIRVYFESKNIDFKQQVRLDDCCNVKALPFDFALHKNGNLTGLIEYQGKQHYMINELFGGENGFKSRQQNDKIKKSYALTHHIPFLEIKYTNLGHLESILEKFLKEIANG
ncbi:Uncharacterised protein [uncultured archaeon]|nr:Uncharacterised protein [uncultured archaeon]